MRHLIAVLAFIAVACGSSAADAQTPTPSPTPQLSCDLSCPGGGRTLFCDIVTPRQPDAPPAPPCDLPPEACEPEAPTLPMLTPHEPDAVRLVAAPVVWDVDPGPYTLLGRTFPTLLVTYFTFGPGDPFPPGTFAEFRYAHGPPEARPTEVYVNLCEWE